MLKIKGRQKKEATKMAIYMTIIGTPLVFYVSIYLML